MHNETKQHIAKHWVWAYSQRLCIEQILIKQMGKRTFSNRPGNIAPKMGRQE